MLSIKTETAMEMETAIETVMETATAIETEIETAIETKIETEMNVRRISIMLTCDKELRQLGFASDTEDPIEMANAFVYKLVERLDTMTYSCEFASVCKQISIDLRDLDGMGWKLYNMMQKKYHRYLSEDFKRYEMLHITKSHTIYLAEILLEISWWMEYPWYVYDIEYIRKYAERRLLKPRVSKLRATKSKRGTDDGPDIKRQKMEHL